HPDARVDLGEERVVRADDEVEGGQVGGHDGHPRTELDEQLRGGQRAVGPGTSVRRETPRGVEDVRRGAAGGRAHPTPALGLAAPRPGTGTVPPGKRSGSSTPRPSTTTRTPGRSSAPSCRYSAWSACTTAASTGAPGWYGSSPSATSSASSNIGSCTATCAP